ncbi:hypothetical protein [Lactococcus lactis]|uniref:hypothetical protein n=2 Tax=Lactococcus lactis TaxID=1358 RepID=UPI00071DB189|nr:hypothetical protein [Lactococcus lactis]MCT0054459.1 hypothetical protein [Lactococcus lactis subsp. lactis]
MKAKTKNFIVKNLSYDGINNLQQVLKSMNVSKGDSFSVKDKLEISNSFSLRKDRMGMLVSTFATLSSTYKNEELALQTAKINTELIIDFELDDNEKTKIDKILDESLIKLLNGYFEPIINIYINDIFDDLVANGVLSRVSGKRGKRALVELDLANI